MKIRDSAGTSSTVMVTLIPMRALYTSLYELILRNRLVRSEIHYSKTYPATVVILTRVGE